MTTIKNTTKLIAIFAILLCVTNAYQNEFNQFKINYNKKYKSHSEELYRYSVFIDNFENSKILQSQNLYANFGITEFSDMTKDEFKIYHNLDFYFAQYLPNSYSTMYDSSSDSSSDSNSSGNTKSNIDWREKGAVTSVKNQGQCGSCWAFSAIGNIEGQWFLAGNNLTSLSEQELVSCDTIDNGCHGGLMTNAFDWIINNNNGYVSSYKNYQYDSELGTVPMCKYSELSNSVATICNYTQIAQNEQDMQQYVYNYGPISVGVDATSWQTYQNGIMTNCISNQVDHGVLIVGYDDTNQPPYWIIKNSWGPTWGEYGYIRIEKNINSCLVTTAPSSAIVCN
jgi:cysteine peptidase B